MTTGRQVGVWASALAAVVLIAVVVIAVVVIAVVVIAVVLIAVVLIAVRGWRDGESAPRSEAAALLSLADLGTDRAWGVWETRQTVTPIDGGAAGVLRSALTGWDTCALRWFQEPGDPDVGELPASGPGLAIVGHHTADGQVTSATGHLMTDRWLITLSTYPGQLQPPTAQARAAAAIAAAARCPRLDGHLSDSPSVPRLATGDTASVAFAVGTSATLAEGEAWALVGHTLIWLDTSTGWKGPGGDRPAAVAPSWLGDVLHRAVRRVVAAAGAAG
jgi:hypothetical protein